VSSALASFPLWVLDYVLVHEMAHLVEADHGLAFRALVERYPKAERAEGFLIAKGMGDDEPDDDPVETESDDVAGEIEPPVDVRPSPPVVSTRGAVQPSLF
jgi:hypothetical protein